MEIVEINRDRFFSFEEAQAVLPIIIRITESYCSRVHALIDRLEKISTDNQGLILEIENEVNALIKQWQGKIQKLGALPKGLWIADFDSGDGYFCWKYPEPRVEFWHSYQDGFSKRMLIAKRQPQVAVAESSQQTIQKDGEI